MPDFLIESQDWIFDRLKDDATLRAAYLEFVPSAEQASFQLWTRLHIRSAPQATPANPLKFPLTIIRWISPASLGTHDNFLTQAGGLVAMGGTRVTAVNRFRVTTAIDRRNTRALSAISARIFTLLGNKADGTTENGYAIHSVWEADAQGDDKIDGITYSELGAFYITELVA